MSSPSVTRLCRCLHAFGQPFRRLSLLLLSSLVLPLADAGAEERFAVESLVDGAPAERRSCSNEAGTVWVEHALGSECIRYFPSQHVDRARIAVIEFHGDRLVGKKPVAYRDNSQAAQLKLAQQEADAAGVPWIRVGRPGVYGSSGDHRQRRQEKEFRTLNAAVTAIRRRHQIEQLVLVGHSGGATAVAALLTMGRTDVRCAVMASGAFYLLERAADIRARHAPAARAVAPSLLRDTTGLRHPYDPAQHIEGIAPDRDRVLIFVGDPQDTVAPYALQRRFASALMQAGHAVLIKPVEARGSAHHDTGLPARALAGRCAKEAFAKLRY